MRSNAQGLQTHRGLISPRSAAAAGVAAATVLAFGSPPIAASTTKNSPDDIHCVLHVIGQEPDGEYITEDLGCFGSLDDALTTAGAIPPDTFRRMSAPAREAVVAAQLTMTIGTHFENANRTGASISVTGSDCGGGYVNLSSDWVDRISSTSNGCGATRFFEGFDKSGASETTNYATLNLGSRNNSSRSIQYAT